jgi:hypothetical protein
MGILTLEFVVHSPFQNTPSVKRIVYAGSCVQIPGSPLRAVVCGVRRAKYQIGGHRRSPMGR